MTTPTYLYLTSSGVIVADTSATLAEVQSEYQQAFGADLIVTADTPQGVLITAETLARNNVINNNAALANQINPNIAGGLFLDAIMALTGVQRSGETPTIVSAVAVTGIAGTTIPQGSLASTAAGDQFQTLSSVTLDISGNGTVNFASIESGPIPCGTTDLNIIISAVLGWETVSNPTAGALGTNTQSDQSARAYRLNTLAFNGISLAEAITSALYATPQVTSLSFLENVEAVPAGALISVTNGTTESGTVWAMTTIAGTGSQQWITCGTDAVNFANTGQTVPTPNPWPVAKYTTTANVTLSGLATQGGGDWPSTMTAGDLVLVKNQTTASQNGVYVVASGAWARQGYFATANLIQPSLRGISLKANSVYTCVEGGEALNIAAALLENKSSGAGWNGKVSESVIEPASGQTYTVAFDTPTVVIILIQITVSGASSDSVVQALIDYANGAIEGFDGCVVGQDISPFELSGAVMAENPGCYVSSCTITPSSPVSYSTNPVPIGLNQIASITANNIVVTLA